MNNLYNEKICIWFFWYAKVSWVNDNHASQVRLIFNSMDYEIHVICDPNKKEEGDGKRGGALMTTVFFKKYINLE